MKKGKISKVRNWVGKIAYFSLKMGGTTPLLLLMRSTPSGMDAFILSKQVFHNRRQASHTKYPHLLSFVSKPVKKISMWNIFQDQHDGI